MDPKQTAKDHVFLNFQSALKRNPRPSSISVHVTGDALVYSGADILLTKSISMLRSPRGTVSTACSTLLVSALSMEEFRAHKV